MYTAKDAEALVTRLKADGASKPDIVRKLAELCLGWPYVYAAAGEMCTPEWRKNRMQYSDDKYAAAIRDACPVLNGSVASCAGCKWDGCRCFDCRGFTRWLLAQVGLTLYGGTAGEIFTASQIFFGGIVIDGSIGVRFIGANIGRNVPITINNSKGTTFTDCNLREAAPSEQFPNTDSPISVTNSSVTRFENCIFEYPSKHQVAANSGNTIFEFEKCYLFNGTVFDPLA